MTSTRSNLHGSDRTERVDARRPQGEECSAQRSYRSQAIDLAVDGYHGQSPAGCAAPLECCHILPNT